MLLHTLSPSEAKHLKNDKIHPLPANCPLATPTINLTHCGRTHCCGNLPPTSSPNFEESNSLALHNSNVHYRHFLQGKTLFLSNRSAILKETCKLSNAQLEGVSHEKYLDPPSAPNEVSLPLLYDMCLSKDMIAKVTTINQQKS